MATNRLNAQQKLILNISNDLNLSEYGGPEPTFDNVNVTIFKKYMEVHEKLKAMLSSEPHEIYTLISTYNGSFKGFNELKNFIRGRNLCIIKKVKNTEQWNKNVQKIVDIFKQKMTETSSDQQKIYELTSDAIFEILLNDVNTFDILQNKLVLDGKNNIKKINMTLDDQKYILQKLISNNVLKKN
jgi:hypothetical protein